MTHDISVADFLEEDRQEVRFEDGEFIYPEKDFNEEISYESYTGKKPNDFEVGLAKVYASTVSGSFYIAENVLRNVYKGISFLAKRG